MPRVLAALMVAMVSFWGCAWSAPPPRPAARPFDQERRLAVVVSGESKFTVTEHRAEPGRTFDEVLKWYPSGAALRPLALVVHRGISWLLDTGRAASVAPQMRGLTPSSVVADALARRLQASGQFEEVGALDREPVGDDRRRADAIARVTVPAWGLVRVREGDPNLVSAFADTRAQLAVRGTGVIVWETALDVTNPERLPLDSFTRDREFARQELMDVLLARLSS